VGENEERKTGINKQTGVSKERQSYRGDTAKKWRLLKYKENKGKKIPRLT